ncbi:PREDICTED: protein EVI2A [Gavialis gangeticus]|uniref:protein EVI2A n=1 Tax=Gavialis gangeticus TaxID=94835 RepID=UPI00092EE95B|nr:PREDICTED: protein EVI2A [Gavialis gangeticus]
MTRPRKAYFAFLAVTSFSLCLQIMANHANDSSYWSSPTQNPSKSLNITYISTTLELITDDSIKTTISTMPASTFQTSPATFGEELSTSSPVLKVTSPAHGTRPTRKTPSTTTKTVTCEDSKPLILVCFIIIAVLILACTCFILSTVVMANKVSYLKKLQKSKRAPRSNGDFLATGSLWPTGSGTWQRMTKEVTGTDLMMQDLMSEKAATVQRKSEDGTTEILAQEREKDQNSQGTSKPCNRILVNFEAEI